MKERILQIAFAVVLIGIDQLGKWQASTSQTLSFNSGAFLGMLPSAPWAVVTPLMLAGIVYYWFKSRQKREQWIAVFIFAGGIGNYIDRMLYGSVRDHIYYPFIKVTGNVADIYLTIAIICMLYGVIKSPSRFKKPA